MPGCVGLTGQACLCLNVHIYPRPITYPSHTPNQTNKIQDTPKFRERPRQYTGKAFVTKDNIDTDQIIPAEYLTLVPSKVKA